MKNAFRMISILLLAAVLCTGLASAAGEIPQGLGDYIGGQFAATHIPGMSVQIVSADEVLFADNYGDCESADTPFILGSLSKSFTAVAIMQLYEQGKIDLDAPFAEYLPEANQERRTTVKQLLNQTSGIHTYMTMENYVSSDTVAGYEYSNVNYNLLGLIVEQLSGESYGEYIQKNIFYPLGMKNSCVSIEKARANGLTSGHRNYFGFMLPADYAYPKDMTSGWMTASAAYIISTANDMGKYLQFYLNGGGDVLSAESIELMQSDTAPVEQGYSYGYAWGVDASTGPTFFVHGGNVENYTTYMMILPESGEALIVLTNACDYFVANDMVIQLAYNTAFKLLGEENEVAVDLAETRYLKWHSIIDAILLVMLLAAVLPVCFIKKWCGKNSGKITAGSIIKTVLLHALLPTFFMLIPTLLGAPMWVAARFAQDVFIVIIVSSTILYLTGAFKLCYYLFAKKCKCCGENSAIE